MTAPLRRRAPYAALLRALDRAYQQGDLDLVADHQAGHPSGPIRDRLAGRERIRGA